MNETHFLYKIPTHFLRVNTGAGNSPRNFKKRPGTDLRRDCRNSCFVGFAHRAQSLLFSYLGIEPSHSSPTPLWCSFDSLAHGVFYLHQKDPTSSTLLLLRHKKSRWASTPAINKTQEPLLMPERRASSLV